jgi:hypothetical protein
MMVNMSILFAILSLLGQYINNIALHKKKKGEGEPSAIKINYICYELVPRKRLIVY